MNEYMIILLLIIIILMTLIILYLFFKTKKSQSSPTGECVPCPIPSGHDIISVPAELYTKCCHRKSNFIKGFFYGCNYTVNHKFTGDISPDLNMAVVFDLYYEHPNVINKTPDYWTKLYNYGSCTTGNGIINILPDKEKYKYKGYCLGGIAVDWKTESKNVTNDFMNNMKKAGYNFIVFDIESNISKDEFLRIMSYFKKIGFITSIYSFQSAGQFFQGFTKDDFVNVDYGMPSIYGGGYKGGNCNYSSICGITFWTDIFPTNKIILGITVGSWDYVKQFEFNDSTIEKSNFAGYIEWIYNIESLTPSTIIHSTDCPLPSPNKCV